MHKWENIFKYFQSKLLSHEFSCNLPFKNIDILVVDYDSIATLAPPYIESISSFNLFCWFKNCCLPFNQTPAEKIVSVYLCIGSNQVEVKSNPSNPIPDI